MLIGNGIHRIGTSDMINAYLLEEGGQVTIVDAGLPGYWGDLPAELAAMGRTLDDVRAVLLTHGHSDHVGFAERIRRERGVPIHILDSDAALARGEVGNPSRSMGPVRIGPLLRFFWYGLRRGASRGAVIAEVSTFGDGATLDARRAAGHRAARPHAGNCRAPRPIARHALHRRRDRDLRGDDGRRGTDDRALQRGPGPGPCFARPPRRRGGRPRPARPRRGMDRRGRGGDPRGPGAPLVVGSPSIPGEMTDRAMRPELFAIVASKGASPTSVEK